MKEKLLLIRGIVFTFKIPRSTMIFIRIQMVFLALSVHAMCAMEAAVEEDRFVVVEGGFGLCIEEGELSMEGGRIINFKKFFHSDVEEKMPLLCAVSEVREDQENSIVFSDLAKQCPVVVYTSSIVDKAVYEKLDIAAAIFNPILARLGCRECSMLGCFEGVPMVGFYTSASDRSGYEITKIKKLGNYSDAKEWAAGVSFGLKNLRQSSPHEESFAMTFGVGNNRLLVNQFLTSDPLAECFEIL